MIFSKYVNKTAVNNAKKAGVQVATAAGEKIQSETSFGGGLFGVGIKAGSERSESFENTNKKAHTAKEDFQDAVAAASSSTIVMGGTPPGKGAMSTGGFAARATRVTLNPVPIQYELVPLSELAEAVVQSKHPPPPPPSPMPPPPPGLPFPPMPPIHESGLIVHRHDTSSMCKTMLSAKQEWDKANGPVLE